MAMVEIYSTNVNSTNYQGGAVRKLRRSTNVNFQAGSFFLKLYSLHLSILWIISSHGNDFRRDFPLLRGIELTL